jgi:hypothetical protein
MHDLMHEAVPGADGPRRFFLENGKSELSVDLKPTKTST